MTPDDPDLPAWVRLMRWPGLGRGSTRKLLAAFGSAGAVVRASHASRLAVLGAAAKLAPLPDESDAESLAAVREWLAAAPARHLIHLGDPAYPPLLLQTADPPLWLFAQGQIEVLQRPSLAMVGSRRSTPQGVANARAMAAELSKNGWVIVSGLAVGIDGAAHLGALDAGGQTVAVVATGLDQVYPAQHQALAARIVDQGLVVSEFPLGTPPLASHFPQRNRIIATLGRGTLVVEAAPQSGSLITARLAAEAGREVFAVPGSIHSPQSRGCHWLLKQGAKLVESAADVLDELRHVAAPKPSRMPGSSGASQPIAESTSDDGDEAALDPVLRALGHDPTTLDALMARCGWPPHELGARLLELELVGQVARLPGGLFQRQRLG